MNWDSFWLGLWLGWAFSDREAHRWGWLAMDIAMFVIFAVIIWRSRTSKPEGQGK